MSLEKSQQRYIAIGLDCMKQLDFVSRPSLPCLQALLSAVRLIIVFTSTSLNWSS